MQCRATDDASNTATASFTCTVRGMITANDLAAPAVVLTSNGQTTVSQKTSVAGRSYQLQRTYALETPASWVNVGSAQAGGGALSFSDSDPRQDKAFYRLAIGP